MGKLFSMTPRYWNSAVMNEMNEYSDIDVAIVSDKFTGVPFYDALKISKFRRAIDLKLEVHPFFLNQPTTHNIQDTKCSGFNRDEIFVAHISSGRLNKLF